MTEAIVVLVTAETEARAAELARTLVQERLAACGNIVPRITSIYWWDGKVQEGNEALLLLKTDRALFERLKARVLELHDYEVPEVIQLDVTAGHSKYLEWILKSVTRRAES